MRLLWNERTTACTLSWKLLRTLRNTINQRLQKTRRFLVHVSKIGWNRKHSSRLSWRCLHHVQSSSKRCQDAGCPLKDKDFDKKLINCVRQQRLKKFRVSRTMIQREETHFVNQRKFQGKHWLVGKVFASSQLGLTPPNHDLSKGPGGICWEDCWLLIVHRAEASHLQLYIHHAADETAIYLDCSSSLTIENKGVQEVPVKTSGHDKLHLTVMLAARSDGFICRPYILLKNKWPINSFGVRLLSEIFGKKYLNARGFAWEFLWSGMLYRPGKSLKRRGKSSSLHSKKIFCLGCAGFLWVTS